MKERFLVPVILTMNDSYWLPYTLEASRGFFDRYVIYDMFSKDNTKDIIQWFIDSCKGQSVEFFVRSLPEVPPSIQGIARNSMIAEARSEYYLILDADEVYTPESFKNIIKYTEEILDPKYQEDESLYGIVRRIEMNMDLTKAWGTEKFIPHHRVYHRTAVFTGPHPGEAPLYSQNRYNEAILPGVECYHFHGTERSPMDAETPKRLERRNRPTYQPGDLKEINILEKLPILKNPIESFEVNKYLKQLQK